MANENHATKEKIFADVVLSDITGTISSVECSDREINYFKQHGAEILNNRENFKSSYESDIRKMSHDTLIETVLMIESRGLETTQGVVDIIMNELNAGNMIPEQMGIASDVIAYGYNSGNSGAFGKARIYEDALAAFVSWRKNGVGIYTFSNGSATLQKAIMMNSGWGDMSGLVTGYLDTMMVGSKKSSDSFKRVQDTIHIDTSLMLFLSDSEKELAAADKAGCHARLVERPGNLYVATDTYGRTTDLRSIDIAMRTLF